MSKQREEERAAKRKKRAAKKRGSSLEELFIKDLKAIGFDARHEETKTRSFGEKRTDVLADFGEIHLLLESKNRKGWKISKEVREKWLGQAERDANRFDERRWWMLGHCNSPGKGIPREPLVIIKWSVMLEILAYARQLEAECAELRCNLRDMGREHYNIY